MPSAIPCPICKEPLASDAEAASHFRAFADQSDVRHVMWLNRKVSMRDIPTAELAAKLRTLLFSGDP
jgi:hypothetical protein